MQELQSLKSPFLRVFAFFIIVLTSATPALTIDPFSDSPGTFSLRVSHSPISEPIAALRVRFFIKPSVQISALTLQPGSVGVWSQVAPELNRNGQTLDVIAIAPNHTDLAVDSSLTLFRLDISSTSGLDTSLIDSVRVVEAYDARAHPLHLSLHTNAFIAGIRVRPPAETAVTLRRVDRIHEIDFFLTKTMPVRARVLDARGKVAIELQNGPMPPGRQRLRWDGRDALGTPSPAGQYYLELHLGPNTYHKSVSHAP